MPKIKHNFVQGKMNKDLDERLVPNGQYKDALNIQVSTSEDSEIGTIQNILGNSSPSSPTFFNLCCKFSSISLPICPRPKALPTILPTTGIVFKKPSISPISFFVKMLVRLL